MNTASEVAPAHHPSHGRTPHLNHEISSSGRGHSDSESESGDDDHHRVAAAPRTTSTSFRTSPLIRPSVVTSLTHPEWKRSSTDSKLKHPSSTSLHLDESQNQQQQQSNQLQSAPESPALSRAKQELALEQVIKAGYLKKKGEQRRSWKQRWFVLRPTRLAYYQSEKEYELLQMIDLASVHAIGEVERTKRDFVFGIVTRARTFYMQAESREEMESWLLATTHQIKEINKNTNNPIFSPTNAVTPFDMQSPSMSPVRMQSASTSPVRMSSIATDFDGRPETPREPISAHSRAGDHNEFHDGDFHSHNEAQEDHSRPSERDPSPGPVSVATTVSLLTIASNTSTTNGQNQHTASSPFDTVKNVIHEEPSSLESSPHHDTELDTPSTSPKAINPAEKRIESDNEPHRASRTSISESTNRPSHVPGSQLSSSFAGKDVALSPLQGRASSTAGSMSAIRRESQVSDSEDDEDRNAHSHLSPEQYQALAKAEQSLICDQIVMQGYLYKLRTSGFGRTWKKRWYVLRNGRLTCYKNESEYEVLHILPLTGVLDILDVDPVDKKGHQYCFRVVLSKKSWTFATDKEQVMNEWINALNRVHSQVKGAMRL